MESTTSSNNWTERLLAFPNIVLSGLTRDRINILYTSEESGSPQVWARQIQSEDSKPRQLSHGSERIDALQLTQDSRSVIFTRDSLGRELHQFFSAPLSGEEVERQISDLKDIRVFDFDISRDDRKIGFTGTTREMSSLYILDIESRKYESIYDLHSIVFGTSWSRDGAILAGFARTTSASEAWELVLADTNTGQTSVYSPKRGSENSEPAFHPNERKVLFKTNAVNSELDLAIYDLDKERISYLNLSKLGFDFPFFGWNSNGDGIWFVSSSLGRMKLYVKKVEPEEAKEDERNPIEMRIPTGSITGVKLASDDSFFAFSWSSLSTPSKIQTLNVQNGKLDLLYEVPMEESIHFAHAELVKYRSFDGLEIHGYILYSTKHGKNKPAPCIVWVHGGPTYEVTDHFNPVFQALAISGFHVLFPNFRGSTGYGDRFEKMNLKDLGGGDLQDVLYAAKFLKECALLEDGKIGIAGASYGGFMTYIALTKHPDVFRAGVAVSGVTDWAENYRSLDTAYRSVISMFFGGAPEEVPDLYLDRSPISFVSQIKSPIMILHRENDSRSPIEPVRKFAEKLEELGKPYELHIIGGAGHGNQNTDEFISESGRVISFLKRQLS